MQFGDWRDHVLAVLDTEQSACATEADDAITDSLRETSTDRADALLWAMRVLEITPDKSEYLKIIRREMGNNLHRSWRMRKSCYIVTYHTLDWVVMHGFCGVAA